MSTICFLKGPNDAKWKRKIIRVYFSCLNRIFLKIYLVGYIDKSKIKIVSKFSIRVTWVVVFCELFMFYGIRIMLSYFLHSKSSFICVN